MKKTIIATTVAGALKITVRKEGKKDRELRTIQEAKGHLDAQSVLVAEKELKGFNWTQIKKELLALKESLKTFKRAKFLLEETVKMGAEVQKEFDKNKWEYPVMCVQHEGGYSVRNWSAEGFEKLGEVNFILKRFVEQFDELKLEERKGGEEEGLSALQSSVRNKFSFEKAFEKAKGEFKTFLRNRIKENVFNSEYARQKTKDIKEEVTLKSKLLLNNKISNKKAAKIFASKQKDFPEYMLEKVTHLPLHFSLEAIEKFEEVPEFLYAALRNGRVTAAEEWVEKQRILFVDGWQQLSKKTPKIAKLFGAAHQEPETIVEIFEFKNLKKALELVPTKFEAMLLTVFVQEKVLLLTKKEACNLAQALVEEYETATNTSGEELDRIIPQKELLWKFKEENVDFLKKLITSIGPEGDVNGLLEKTKREVRKHIASMETMNVFRYFQEEYGIGDLDTLSCSIPENKIEMDGLTARVLAANDPFQVAMGDYSLGGIKCCQCRGDAAETSVAEGLQNPNSGFFGIWDEKGLIAQAWLWTAQSREVLVFDNIELNKGRSVNFDKIKKILLDWCEAAPYQKIQLGLGYTKLNTSNFEEVKEDFVLGDFEFDPYTDADEARVWLKKH